MSKCQYFENIEKTEQQQYVDAQCNCVLCGSALELQHIVLDQEDKIREEAFCSNCDVKTRVKTFTVN